jgi:hypothetical protein
MLGFWFFLAQLLQRDVSADSYKAWFPRLAKTSKTKVKMKTKNEMYLRKQRDTYLIFSLHTVFCHVIFFN